MQKRIIDERKQMLFELINDESYKPLKFRELAIFLGVPKSEREELREIMSDLINEGKIILDEKGKYKLASDEIKTGTFLGTSKSFGFVSIEGEDDDIFIPSYGIGNALNGDKVQVRVLKERTGKRLEGEILHIIEHANETVVGIFKKSNNFGFVIADNQKLGKDIFVAKEHTKNAVDGHKVVVKITNYGDDKKKPQGKIIEILGHINDPGVDILSVTMAYNLPTKFPDDVMKQIDNIPDEVDSKDIAGRKDIRNLQTVTIDGEDAKDLDDAITLTKENGIYTLGVHIADVSHYVSEGSPLDKEALNRGTSAYLVDRVIPMLPHKLSNGICSLNMGTDRLALSCFMDIDSLGTVIGHEIAETVIRVDERMSYTSVKKILEDKDTEEIEKYEQLIPMFEDMLVLANILREKRRKRGSIDFDFPESKIILDEKGIPTDIKAYERNKATKIIEDFMLIANETVAEDFFWQEIPFVYRNHDYPDTEKIQKLGIFINNFGFSLKIGQGEIHPKEIQKLLTSIEDTPEEPLISRLTLRSMKQAKYTTECAGHFGLSTKYYCHFTSPIRRYPDLQIHRIIKEQIRGGISKKREEHYENMLNEVARQSSFTERRAEEAEREVEKLKKAVYMKKFIGEIFDGVISGVTAHGLYVELPNTVEGMIEMSDLGDDYYIYDDARYMLVGEHTRKIYKLGQKVKIEVTAVDRLTGRISFGLSEEDL